MMTTLHHVAVASLCIAIATIVGCDGSADLTEDSTRLEVEVPKVEIGEEPVDMDLGTDDDVDIDTPVSGDS
ncbi:hypothetical protein FF011L_15840 [Roseimaritima multifibrata]|uniref:Uncharacterized protein n=1 Tax=Roseimaritima multifibrata TaxID=1930274 RepID=A0A517MD77_9BACT|nr:hypothetical protein [Roseimaritima multifibrata]QDS92835.1 hypothetical protein FF011L_15840 [Roseimaritima multifibrata]